jgi:hypothetical protein
MRKIYILLLALVCAGVAFGQTEKQKVAVYVTGGSDVNMSRILGSKIVQAIIDNGKYSAVERTENILDMLRKEQAYQRSGNTPCRCHFSRGNKNFDKKTP